MHAKAELQNTPTFTENRSHSQVCLLLVIKIKTCTYQLCKRLTNTNVLISRLSVHLYNLVACIHFLMCLHIYLFMTKQSVPECQNVTWLLLRQWIIYYLLSNYRNGPQLDLLFAHSHSKLNHVTLICTTATCRIQSQDIRMTCTVSTTGYITTTLQAHLLHSAILAL